MKNISLQEKDIVDSLFQNSIYTNNHLGWFDIWQILNNNGYILLDEEKAKHFLIALQPVTSDILWLHSFYVSSIPENYPLSDKLKNNLSSGRHSIYTIASHKWYSDLLKRNSFRVSDEIIQLETADITHPAIREDPKVSEFPADLANAAWENCESGFPPLWRISKKEFAFAHSSSNYRRMILQDGKPIAYLLADINNEDCYIERLLVSPDYQKKGFASSLVLRMIKDCHKIGISKFLVNTNANNTEAIRFYKNLNFRTNGERLPVYHRFIYTTG
ncbi:MAG: GNAT family N-acetyltransferase [Anaerolineaceae bacterium]|nr:GNAT family N-acetyltransferase [Anaerolineaceae bacterium]